LRCGIRKNANAQGMMMRATSEKTIQVFSHFHLRRYFKGTMQFPTMMPPKTANRMPHSVCTSLFFSYRTPHIDCHRGKVTIILCLCTDVNRYVDIRSCTE